MPADMMKLSAEELVDLALAAQAREKALREAQTALAAAEAALANALEARAENREEIRKLRAEIAGWQEIIRPKRRRRAKAE